MGHLFPPNSIHENGSGRMNSKSYLKPFQTQNDTKNQPRSLNMHSANISNTMSGHGRPSNSLLMTTTSKYTLNQHSDNPKSLTGNPSTPALSSHQPQSLSIFRGGRSSSVSTESPQATSSSGGDISPPNDYFKKQMMSNKNGPQSLNWASVNSSSYNGGGETPSKKSKHSGNTLKSKKSSAKSTAKVNGNSAGGNNGSECGTSSTECGSDYSDQNSTTDDKPIVYNVSTSSIVVPNCKGKTSGIIGHNSRGKPKVNVVTPTPAPRTSVHIPSLEGGKLSRFKDPKLSLVTDAIGEEASWSYQDRKKRQESLV